MDSDMIGDFEAHSHVQSTKYSSLLSSSLRKGKWTVEEEQYANKIIFMFSKGILHIPTGTTLRSYLSEKLNCDPMRITKKFAGPSCIGKQIFQPLEDRIPLSSSTNIRNVDMTPLELKNNELELESLEKIFRSRQGDAIHPSNSYNHPKSSMFSSINSSSSDQKPVKSSPHDGSLLNQQASSTASNTRNPVERTGGRIIIPTSSDSITEGRRTPVLPGFIPFTSASKQPTSIPSNKSNQSISTHNSSSNNSSTGNVTTSSSSMLRRAMSAPELHILSHSKWHKLAGNQQQIQGDPMNDNQLIIEAATTQRDGHQKRKHASWSKQSLSRKSLSMDNLFEFEDYYSDDLAAGDLLIGFFQSVTDSEPASDYVHNEKLLSPSKTTALHNKKINIFNQQKAIEPPMKRQVLSKENCIDQADEYCSIDNTHVLAQGYSPSFETPSPVIEISEHIVSTPSLKEPVLLNTLDDPEDRHDRVRKTSITSGSTDGDSHSLSHLLQLHTLQPDTAVHSPIAEEGLCLDDL